MELTLPMNYVELEQEEMMYLDGGAYFSKNECRLILMQIGVTAYVAQYAIATAAIVSRFVRHASKAGGILETVIGLALTIAAKVVGKMLYGIGVGATVKNGVNINASWSIFDSFVNVTW